MKKTGFLMLVIVAGMLSGCATMNSISEDFNKGMEEADARRAEKQAAKKGIPYYGKKQLAQEPGTAKKVSAPAPVSTEQMLLTTCKDGVAQYDGSFMTKRFNDNTVSFSDNGIMISKHDTFGGGVYSDFYYHPDVDVIVELVYADGDFGKIKADTFLRSHVHILDNDKSGSHHGETINPKSTYAYNKAVYDQICTDKIEKIGLSKTFIRVGYLRSLTFQEPSVKNDRETLDSDTLRGYQNRSSFKAVIEKYAGEKTIKNPVGFITKLLNPATKAQFEADILKYFAGGK